MTRSAESVNPPAHHPRVSSAVADALSFPPEPEGTENTPEVLASVILVSRDRSTELQTALESVAGQIIRDKLEDGLVREDGMYLYPVRGSIPVLLIDEAIPLS